MSNDKSLTKVIVEGVVADPATDFVTYGVKTDFTPAIPVPSTTLNNLAKASLALDITKHNRGTSGSPVAETHYGSWNVTADTTLQSTLEVDDAATFKSTLHVDGDVTLGSKLDVSGATTLKTTLEVDQGTTLKTTLEVDGDATLGSKLDVSGVSTFHGQAQALTAPAVLFGSASTSSQDILRSMDVFDNLGNTTTHLSAVGFASLDINGKIPTNELPGAVLGALTYMGTWDASGGAILPLTASPTNLRGLPAIPTPAPANKGSYYKVSIPGTTTIDGISNWTVGDWVISNGSNWEKIDAIDSVISVAGKSGSVDLYTTDLLNVSQTAPTNGQFLEWIVDPTLIAPHIGEHRWVPSTLNLTTALSQLSDVTWPTYPTPGSFSPADGQVLTYSSALGKWTYESLPELHALTDVTVATAATGNILVVDNVTTPPYSVTAPHWTNSTIANAGLEQTANKNVSAAGVPTPSLYTDPGFGGSAGDYVGIDNFTKALMPTGGLHFPDGNGGFYTLNIVGGILTQTHV